MKRVLELLQYSHQSPKVFIRPMDERVASRIDPVVQKNAVRRQRVKIETTL